MRSLKKISEWSLGRVFKTIREAEISKVIFKEILEGIPRRVSKRDF